MKKEWILIFLLTLGYAIFSFSNLGSFENPNTFEEGKEIILEVEDPSILSKIRYFTGHNFQKMEIYTSLDNENYELLSEHENIMVFTWNDISFEGTFRYLKIVLEGETSLGEVAIYDDRNQIMTLKNIKNGTALIDESEVVPEEISYKNSAYFDEVYFARTAYEYANGLSAYEWVHPPLAKLLSALPIKLFKMAPFYYRFMGNLAATLMIPILYLFSKKMFKKTKYAFFTTCLLIFDNFHFAQGRIGTTDSMLAFFILNSYYFMYLYVQTKREDSIKKKLFYLFASSIFIACSISTKWTGLFAGLGLAIIFFSHFFKTYRVDKKITKDGKKIFIFCGIFFAFHTIVLYLSCYLLFPNMYYFQTRNLSEIINITKEMYRYHSQLKEYHPFYSSWYSWLVMYKPVWYYEKVEGSLRATISGIGNPFVWILGTISMVVMLYQTIRKKDHNAQFLTIGYLCFLLPYMNINRGMFLYHYYPCYLITMLASTYVIKKITEKKKVFYWIFLIATIFFFLHFYPVVSGKLTDSKTIENLRWFSSWIF